MMRFIDLFCGIGGFRVALQGLGGKCVFSCDNDKFAASFYSDNFGDITFADLRNVKVEDIPSHDVLCAGLPCQTFSKSGKMGR